VCSKIKALKIKATNNNPSLLMMELPCVTKGVSAT